MEKSVYQRIALLWVIQIALIVASSVLLVGLNPVIAYSFALGAFNFLLPNAYFALKALRYTGLKHNSEWDDHAIARLILQNFYRAEMNKFVLAATGFAVIFAIVDPINGLALFGGFLTLMLSQFVILSRWALG